MVSASKWFAAIVFTALKCFWLPGETGIKKIKMVKHFSHLLVALKKTFKMKGFNRKRSYLLLLFLLVFTTMGIAQEISGNYAIKNLETGLLLRVKDANSKNGTPLVAYEPQNWKCMTWDFISAGDNVYQLKNLFTGKTFQQKAGSDGSTLEEQPLEKGKEAQLYTFEAVGENIYRIKLKGSTLYLTNNKAEVNAPIVLKPKTTDKNQLWQIYQQSPTM